MYYTSYLPPPDVGPPSSGFEPNPDYAIAWASQPVHTASSSSSSSPPPAETARRVQCTYVDPVTSLVCERSINRSHDLVRHLVGHRNTEDKYVAKGKVFSPKLRAADDAWLLELGVPPGSLATALVKLRGRALPSSRSRGKESRAQRRASCLAPEQLFTANAELAVSAFCPPDLQPLLAWAAAEWPATPDTRGNPPPVYVQPQWQSSDAPAQQPLEYTNSPAGEWNGETHAQNAWSSSCLGTTTHTLAIRRTEVCAHNPSEAFPGEPSHPLYESIFPSHAP